MKDLVRRAIEIKGFDVDRGAVDGGVGGGGALGVGVDEGGVVEFCGVGVCESLVEVGVVAIS